MEARNVQSRIEERTGAQLNFNLKPGDSVFQTFDDFHDDTNDNVKSKQRRRRSQNDQLLTVSPKTKATKKNESQGLKAVSDYLKNSADIEGFDSNSSYRKGKLKRSNSDNLFRSTSQPLNSSIFSEYKEYLRSLSKTMPAPNFKKLLPLKAKSSIENNPIIVVTNY
jgi:hypothetical protein